MTEKEFLISSYVQQTVSKRDLIDDNQRISRICNIIETSNWEQEGQLLLNQLVSLFNVFYIGNALLLLEMRMNPEHYEKLYSVLIGLDFLRVEDYPCDLTIVTSISELLEGDFRYEKVFRSFRGRRWWGSSSVSVC